MYMESHLDENELAQYVEAIALNRQNELPKGILEHIAQCFECKVEVLEVLELVLKQNAISL